jgi:hypothetical protein
MPGIYIFVVALFFYAIPYAAIYRASAFTSLFSSLKYFMKNPITSILLSVLILMVPVSISIIMNTPNIIVEKFYPELVYWILATGLFIDIFIFFFWMGTATSFLKNQE